MRRNVNMADEFVKFEVNRYLGWPGQAPSYKVGQRIWEQIRDAAQTSATAPTSRSRTSTSARSTSAASVWTP